MKLLSPLSSPTGPKQYEARVLFEGTGFVVLSLEKHLSFAVVFDRGDFRRREDGLVVWTGLGGPSIGLGWYGENDRVVYPAAIGLACVGLDSCCT